MNKHIQYYSIAKLENEYNVMEKEVQFLNEAANNYYQLCELAHKSYENEYNKAVKLGTVNQAFQISRLQSLYTNFVKKNDESRKLWDNYENKVIDMISIKYNIDKAKRFL